ncbi:HAT, C-terminal dimerisation domain [Cinara cedri]|uniref:HAT, C-terminal dimerisation domain n=1 Tax=Cinara cedri TaxID=506608 RepID=A0A5E4MUA5_9HEMI|nr:HAT, C-terminal dimerisation domain [Cinara cedri]
MCHLHFKKRFESEASKRKHKAEEDRKTKLLPSVSKFFKKVSVEISYSNPNVNENLQETHPCPSLSSPVKIEHISQNVTSNANLSSKLVNTISQEIPAYNVPNIDIFTKLLTLPNPTDIDKNELGIPISIEIREDFIGFTEAEGGTGRAMEEQSMKQFKKNGLDIIKFREIGLDGAASMSGKYNGLKAFLRQRQKKAKYVHCASHNLNLISPGADTGKAADLIKSTLQIIEAIRMNIDILIEEANDKALKWNVTPQFSNKRTIEVKRFYDELCQDQRLSQGCQYFKTQVLYSCILRRGVISDDDIIIGAKKLADEFEDFNPAELARQIESFNILFSSELESYLLTKFYLFLTLPVTVASAKRSFSKLKLIKSYLRNTMSQTRLSGLAMISIENERAKKLNMSALIKSFAQDRSRKKLFLF